MFFMIYLNFKFKLFTGFVVVEFGCCQSISANIFFFAFILAMTLRNTLQFLVFLFFFFFCWCCYTIIMTFHTECCLCGPFFSTSTRSTSTRFFWGPISITSFIRSWFIFFGTAKGRMNEKKRGKSSFLFRSLASGSCNL